MMAAAELGTKPIHLNPELTWDQLRHQARSYLLSSPHHEASHDSSHSGYTVICRELDWLTCHVLRRPGHHHLSDPDSTLSASQCQQLSRLLHRRWQGEPLAYLLGHADFYQHTFAVNHHTLIPRPETEELVERLAHHEHLKNRPPATIMDVGTGSGCIAISLAMIFPRARVLAVDISAPALAMATANIIHHQLRHRIHTVRMDMRSAAAWQQLHQLHGAMELVVANPPYVDYATESSLLSSGCHHEPKLALDGGQDGLEFITALHQHVPTMLHRRQGWFALEMGFKQARPVMALFNLPPWHAHTIYDDLSGNSRFLLSTLT